MSRIVKKPKNIVKDFDDLIVYKLSEDMANWIYDVTRKFPSDEKYNLVSQLKRAVTSIGANIAEGYGRYHYKENIQYCRQARGSLAETKRFILRYRNFNKQNKVLRSRFLFYLAEREVLSLRKS